MTINLKSVVSKLNGVTRAALEGAAGLCLARTHYDVEIEHFLTKLLDVRDSDFAGILRQFGVDKGRFSAELSRSLDKLKTGNARTPAFSPSLFRMLTQAWTIGSLEYDCSQVRSGLAVLALTLDDDLARLTRDIGKEIQKIEPDSLRRQLPVILSASPENTEGPVAAGANDRSDPSIAPSGGKTPNLDQFTVDLTENARTGKIDPVLGRDFEIRQIIDILTRRRQNNPILTGEAGVGKTAVVEGFALRIAKSEVPPALRNVTVRALDLALLQAGAGIKGEFENRLKGLIQEVKSSAAPIILFIDEAHTMIGAGGTAGQNDAANILKPALARGELRTIAATTWSEYKKYFEKDAALARRFQVIKVEEPTEAVCEMMLRGIVPALENHHGVRILEDGLAAAVKLSHRYIPDRQLPDKAVSVLDTACARLALSQNAAPPAIEDAIREIEDCTVQTRVLTRESAMGVDHTERLAAIGKQKSEAESRLGGLRLRWSKERELVSRVREIRRTLEDDALTDATAGGVSAGASEIEALRSELLIMTAELGQLQGEEPLVNVSVDADTVSCVVSAWTGIPVGKMLRDDVENVLCLESHLGKRIIGQEHALTLISERIRTSRAGMEDPRKPVGVFLLVGPSGVGKTETAVTLAELLYGGEQNLITINMSEFQEAHTVSTLKGSPPGYVGYGEGGVLTEAVRRRPYSVVLLDEIEKAHPDVLELFFQVFDKGRMEDGEGRGIDFRNTVIILTSNAGSDMLMELTQNTEPRPSADELVRALKPELNGIFKPAFLARLAIIPYYPIDDTTLMQIVRLKIGKIQQRFQQTCKVALTCGEDLVLEVASRCAEVESGARNVDSILSNTVLPQISRLILARIAERRRLSPIHVSLGEDRSFIYREIE